MNWNDARTETMKVGWNFYQRAIDNYSVIMRIMELNEDLLISEAPRIFIEESFFDTCSIIVNLDGIARQGFYAIDSTFAPIDHEDVAHVKARTGKSAIMEDHPEYGTLYIYMIKRHFGTIGYLILGKRYNIELKSSQVRELEIISEFYAMLLIRGTRVAARCEDHSMFESVLESFPDPLILVDANGCIGYANRKAKRQFETTKGFLLNERVDKAIPGLPEDLVRDRQTFTGEINYRLDDNYRVYRVESFIVPEKRGGEWLAIIFKDVVALKASEEERFVRKRNESVGMLAGGIAHDFNNMLTGILGYAALIKKMVNDVQLGRYAEAIEHSAQRASGLTKHLLNFSRRQKKSTGLVDINLLLDDVLFLIKKSFHGIKVVSEFDSMLPAVRGDEAELQNVFLNLFMNARDAMNGNGTLRVSTEKYEQDRICVQIEDTGRGIDETLRHKIFEPYFSTKEEDVNLGMGLYLVDRVIKEHGGFIEIKSEPEKGTCFELYLPVPPVQSAAGVQMPHKPVEEAIKNKKILIVDDEYLIRELLRNYLLDKGATLLEAGNGEDALRIYRENRDTIDLVVLDVIMPGIKGDEILRLIREEKTETKVIIASGFMSERQREKLQELKVDGFLDKPFKDDNALAIIGEVLSRS